MNLERGEPLVGIELLRRAKHAPEIGRRQAHETVGEICREDEGLMLRHAR